MCIDCKSVRRRFVTWVDSTCAMHKWLVCTESLSEVRRTNSPILDHPNMASRTVSPAGRGQWSVRRRSESKERNNGTENPSLKQKSNSLKFESTLFVHVPTMSIVASRISRRERSKRAISASH